MDDYDEAATGGPAAPARMRLVKGAMAAAVTWVLLALLTRSIILALFCVVILAALAGAAVFAIKVWGSYPSTLLFWLQARPWRDGPATLRTAGKRFPALFVRSARGQFYAPCRVDVLMSPGCVSQVYEGMEPEIVDEILVEDYRSVIRAYGARLAGSGAVAVTLVSAANVPDGAIVVRRAPDATDDRGPAGAAIAPNARDGRTLVSQWDAADAVTRADPQAGVRATPEGPGPDRERGPDRDDRAAQPPTPTLTLHTGGVRRSTTLQRAVAGRDPGCDLFITSTKTVSRQHGVFTFKDGQWWLESVGRNGIQVNGTDIKVPHAVAHEDVIRWGSLDNSPTSVVQIDRSRYR